MDPLSHEEHQTRASELVVRCAVITVSDTRGEADDHSGALIKARLSEAGHLVESYDVVPDEPEQVADLVRRFAAHHDALLLNGGTGISGRDRTFEAVSGLLDRTLPGFGELFRMLSYEQVGAAAMLSRAIAGVSGHALVFSMPGSPNAVRLAMDRLILPELKHLVWELRRHA